MNIQTSTAAVILLLLTLTPPARAQGNIFTPSADKAITAAINRVADEAYQLNMRGLDALDRKDLNEAMDHFDQAIGVFPQYSDALNNRGVVLYRRGDVAGAQKTWEDIIRRDPQYHVSYYNIGLIYLHDKKPDEAQKQFELALKYNKRFTEAMLRIGSIHLQAGRKATALEWFAKAYKDSPKHQDAWNFYSYGLLTTGDTAGAVTVLKNAGDDANALAQLGRIEGVRKRYAQAAEYLSKAVSHGAPASVALDLASVQIDAGNCKGALATLGNYFMKELNPSVDAWLLAGFAARECGGAAKALEYYEKGLKQYPRDQLLTYNAGQVYFSQKNYAKADEAWNAVGDTYQDPQMLYMRAVAARFRNDLPAAERHIKKAISLDEKAEYHDFLGVLYHTKGDGKTAEEHFRKALKIDPNNASAQLNLAVKGKSAADLDKAVADASKRLSACKPDENCADAALQLSILYYHQKKIDRALSTVESVKDAHRDARVYRHIAIFSRELQRHDKAVAALEAASTKFPGDLKIRYELAEAYLSAGAPSKAARIFTELLPKWKEDVWRLHYQLGYALMEQNDLISAKASFEKSLAAKKDNFGARALLAFVLNRMGETDKAVDQWEKTVKEDGNNATIHINLGLSYENKGAYDRALESYKKAQSLDPSDKAININLGNAYEGLGRIPEAFEAYTKGLESGKRDLAAYNIFLLSRKRNDRDRAEKMYALLKKEFPSSTHTARVSGEMDLLKGDTAKALAAYEAIKEKDVHDWYALARVYAARGQRAKADAALAKMPNDGHWGREKKIIMAALAFNSGDYRAAYSAYRDVIGAPQSGKEDADAYIYNMILAAYNGGMHKEALAAANDFAKRVQGKGRAEVYRVAGNSAVAVKSWPDAKNWFGQLAALEPNSAVTQYNLAVAHYNLGEVEDAHSRYRKARELDKKIQNKDIELRYEQFKRGGPSRQGTTVSSSNRNDSLDAWYNSAVDLQNAKKDTLAERLYRRILEQDPAYGVAWNNLGAIYGARGELDQAEAAYVKAIESQPTPETYANLANVYIALEQLDKARAAVTKGLAQTPNSAVLKRLDQKIRGGGKK